MNNKKLKDKKKYLIFSELHSLLGSGLNFSNSFELLINDETNKTYASILNDIYTKVLNGSSLWKSLQTSDKFTSLDCGVIRIGEETGKINSCLLFLSDYYHKKIEQRRLIIGALSYPSMVIIMAIIVLIFMLTVVIPMFEQVYARMGGELPAITQIIIKLSHVMPLFLAIGGILFSVLIGMYTFYKKEEWFRRISSDFVLFVPVVSGFIKKHYQAQFCKLLYLLESSEVPLLKSLDLLATVITFYPYQQSFREISLGLKKGDSFSNNLEKFSKLYEKKLATLIRVGEETNSLENVLDRHSVDLTAELDHELKQLSNALEPILILLIGFFVAFILIAMYMPMFRLGQTMG